MTTEDGKDGLQAEELLVVLDRDVSVLEQDLEGGEDVLEVLDGHEVAKLGKAVKNRMEQFDPTGLGSTCVAGRQSLENAEVDSEEDVGDVGGKPEPGLRRLLASSFQKLLVQLGSFFGSLLLTLALETIRKCKFSPKPGRCCDYWPNFFGRTACH